MTIDGRKIADEILSQLKFLPPPKKFLAAFYSEGKEDAFGFLKLKREFAAKLGIDFRTYELPAGHNNDRARRRVFEIVKHKTCGGAFIQLPLADNLNFRYISNAIPPEKDIDVMGERALGAFYNRRSKILPPAVEALKEVLMKGLSVDEFALEQTLKSKTVSVVGAGFLIGRPVAVWLMGRVAELLVLDKGSGLSLLKTADIVVSGAGQPHLISGASLKAGAGAVDFGYGRINGSLAGDFNLDKTDHLSFYTPTPGGTGPILIAALLRNFYKLNQKQVI